VQIVGVSPDDGSVASKIRSDIVPLVEPKVATLIIELSKKPLIILFWIGSLIVFLAGIIAMIDRKRRPDSTADFPQPAHLPDMPPKVESIQQHVWLKSTPADVLNVDSSSGLFYPFHAFSAGPT
jgi:hypothetical protein